MSAYLEEHLPHLRSLHSQLALDETALSNDSARIESAIKAAVSQLLREREAEVDAWKEAIGGEKRKVTCLSRALGKTGKGVAGNGRDSLLDTEPLPTQYESVIKQTEELEKIYKQRLEHIERQQGMLDSLAILLGAPWEPSKPLIQVASCSTVAIPPPTAAAPRRGSGLLARNAGGRRSGSNAGSSSGPRKSDEEGKEMIFVDVGEEVTELLEKAVNTALEERATRLQDLQQNLLDLRTLHSELALPPVPINHPHHFPTSLLPSRSSEETPGAHLSYEKLLSRIIAERPVTTNEDEEEEGEIAALEGVEPEVGLIKWAEEILTLWDAERESREGRIQTLFNQLEPLWLRLEIEQDQLDLFIQMNIGCSESTIKAYEAELDRCLELRRSSLSAFIVGARKEIEMLWTELMMSNDEKGEFGAFINDDYSEELLKEHEDEAERLRDEIESKAAILPRVREWHSLVADEEELERSMADPNRFTRRGGALLKEEKLRKRVSNLKPKVEQELLGLLPAWEESNGRPFMVSGVRVVDKIHDELAAKEEAKEAKKRARQGLGPAPPGAASKPLGATRTVKPTPGAKATGRNPPASTLRKREAPTPLAGYGTNIKRAKVTPSITTASSRITSGIPKSRIVSATTIVVARPRDPSSSPTFRCNLPRPAAGTTARAVSNPIPPKSAIPLPSLSGLAKANGMRPRRQSFKPRQSLAAGMLALSRKGDPWGGGGELIEEGEEGEGEDVFE